MIKQKIKNKINDNLIERIIVAIACVTKRAGMARWEDTKGSYVVTFKENKLQISVANASVVHKHNVRSYLTREFGFPTMTFERESTLNPGLHIFYMEWENNANIESIKEAFDKYGK